MQVGIYSPLSVQVDQQRSTQGASAAPEVRKKVMLDEIASRPRAGSRNRDVSMRYGARSTRRDGRIIASVREHEILVENWSPSNFDALE